MNDKEMSKLMGTFLAFKSVLDEMHGDLYGADVCGKSCPSGNHRNEYLSKADARVPKLKRIFKELDEMLMGHAISRTGK